MQSKITLIGLYNFDNSLFNNLTFPNGINRDLAIERILNKSEEFEVLYSNFDYLKDRIGTWSKIWERTFEKWVKALAVEYDPLYNFDRHEFYTDAKARDYRDNQNSIASSSAVENSESVSNTVTGSDTGSTTEQFVNAYDGGYTGKEKEESSAVTNQSGSGDSKSDISSTNNSFGSTNNNGTSNELLQHEARLFGNIGVTTSQQMLKDELDIATWNLYEHISDIFIEEFCILIY